MVVHRVQITSAAGILLQFSESLWTPKESEIPTKTNFITLSPGNLKVVELLVIYWFDRSFSLTSLPCEQRGVGTDMESFVSRDQWGSGGCSINPFTVGTVHWIAPSALVKAPKRCKQQVGSLLLSELFYFDIQVLYMKSIFPYISIYHKCFYLNTC